MSHVKYSVLKIFEHPKFNVFVQQRLVLFIFNMYKIFFPTFAKMIIKKIINSNGILRIWWNTLFFQFSHVPGVKVPSILPDCCILMLTYSAVGTEGDYTQILDR